MAVRLTTYDPAADLASDRAMAAFMAEAFATEDPGYIAHAVGVVARANCMARIAEQTRSLARTAGSGAQRTGQSDVDDSDRGDEGAGIELTVKVPG